MRLAVSALLRVVAVERRLELQLGHGRQVEGASEVRRPLLGNVVLLRGELARLADRRVDAGVLHDGGRAVEPLDVAYLGDDLGAERVADAGYGEDQRLDSLDSLADLDLDLGDLPLDEVDLLDEQLDLEGEG